MQFLQITDSWSRWTTTVPTDTEKNTSAKFTSFGSVVNVWNELVPVTQSKVLQIWIRCFYGFMCVNWRVLVSPESQEFSKTSSHSLTMPHNDLHCLATSLCQRSPHYQQAWAMRHCSDKLKKKRKKKEAYFFFCIKKKQLYHHLPHKSK